MSHFKAEIHQVRFLASDRLSLCPFLRLSFRWSLTLTGFGQMRQSGKAFLDRRADCSHRHNVAERYVSQQRTAHQPRSVVMSLQHGKINISNVYGLMAGS